MSSSSSSSSGIGLFGMTFIVFLVLKLAEIGVVATWSWWWVTAPLWIPLAFILVVVAAIFAFAGILYLIGLCFGRSKGRVLLGKKWMRRK